MAVFRTQRCYSISEDALVGGLIGAGIGGLTYELKPALILGLGGALIGGIHGAIKAYKKNKRKTKSLSLQKTKKIVESNEITFDQPVNLQELLQKYPKLRDLNPFIKNQDKLIKLVNEIDNHGFIKDWDEMYLDINDPDEFIDFSKKVRESTGNYNLIACLGGGEISFDVATSKFYLVDIYSEKIKETTIKDFSKNLVSCLDENRYSLEDLSFEEKKNLNNFRLELKKLLQV